MADIFLTVSDEIDQKLKEEKEQTGATSKQEVIRKILGEHFKDA